MEFEKIYHLYKDMVYNLSLHYLQQQLDAEDITQNVFLKVFDNLHKFRNESDPKTWIYRITINECLDYIKASKVKKREVYAPSISIDGEDFHLPLSVHSHPGIQLEDKESLDILMRCIYALPFNQKSIIILLKIESKSQKEVADIMEISEKAVEALFQRAKKNLKELLIKAKEI